MAATDRTEVYLAMRWPFSRFTLGIAYRVQDIEMLTEVSDGFIRH